MKEHQIEAMYRARLDERRHATEALDILFTEATAGRDHPVWLIAVAHPRVSRLRARLTREEAQAVLKKAEHFTLTLAGRGKLHPLEIMDRDSPRPGLRRWVVRSPSRLSTYEGTGMAEAWGSIHHDGSVTIAVAVDRTSTASQARCSATRLSRSLSTPPSPNATITRIFMT